MPLGIVELEPRMTRSRGANVNYDLDVLVSVLILSRTEYGVTKGRIDDLGIDEFVLI